MVKQAPDTDKGRDTDSTRPNAISARLKLKYNNVFITIKYII